MNLPQDLGLGSFIVQSHGNLSVSTASPEYLYTTNANAQGFHAHHHSHSHSHPGHSSHGQDQELTSGQGFHPPPSSDDGIGITFYNTGTGSAITSHHLNQQYGEESKTNVTTSLYGLVTAPVLTPSSTSSTDVDATISNAFPSSSSSIHPHLYQNVPRLLHPHSASQHSTSPHAQSQVQNGTSPNQRLPSSYPVLSCPSQVQVSRVMADARTDASSTSSQYQHQHHQHRHHHQMGHHHYNRHQSSHHRKRKSPIPTESDADDDSETCSSRRTATPTGDDSSKKQNHSEIEKRRRDKMNKMIGELSQIIPMCNSMTRKLDKLTVLRMAVQHMKTLRGSRIHSYTEGHYKPSFLTDEEVKHLILQSAEGFLFVVGCDRGRLLYISESVSQVLNYSQSDLLGQSWFDILHPKDVAKVKEQLSSSDLAPRERLIDVKTMLPVKGNVPQKANRLCPGARRSFFCRMKCKNSPAIASVIKEEADLLSPGCQQRKKKSSNWERKFCVVHCTGYLKSWAKVGGGMEESESGDVDNDACNISLSCLVAVGRILKPISAPSPNSQQRPITFISRHAIDGKFVFVDQRATLVVGFLPQELLGTSMYEYFHEDDIASLAQVHKAVLTSNETMTTQMYRFRTRSGACVRLQSTWKSFRNPWTKDIEYIIAKNVLAPFGVMDIPPPNFSMIPREESFQNNSEFEFFSGGESTTTRNSASTSVGNGEIQRLIHSEAPFRKIGEQIADEIVECQRRNDSSSSNSPESVLEAAGLGSASMSDLQLQLPTVLSPQTSTAQQQLPMLHTMASSQSQISGSDSATASPSFQHHGHGFGTLPQAACSPGTAISSTRSTITAESMGMTMTSNDPVMGAASAPATSTSSTRPIRTNGNNSNLVNLRNVTNANVLNEPDEEMLYMIGESVMPDESNHSEDGNDEAAMAVIMSLLEADAGLGGPVDFSGLPWPLP